MTVTCSLKIESLETEAFAAIDYRVMAEAFECQNQIGRLAEEQIYQASLSERLLILNLNPSREILVEVSHKNFLKQLFLDLVIDMKAVYELKVVAKLISAHEQQMMTYLYLLDLERGKLVNFGASRVESKFINTPVPRETRVNFALRNTHYHGSQEFMILVLELLRDFGTCLSVSLYHEAINCLLSSKLTTPKMLPISINDKWIGNQRFHLAAPDEAYRVTAFNRTVPDYKDQLQNLLRLSPLRSIHWINIETQTVTISTIGKS